MQNSSFSREKKKEGMAYLISNVGALSLGIYNIIHTTKKKERIKTLSRNEAESKTWHCECQHS